MCNKIVKPNKFGSFFNYLLELPSTNGEIPWYDGAGRSIECTKKAMGLKVYMMIKTYGDQLFSSYVDKTYDLAREFEAYINVSDDFELGAIPESNIVCFRLKNPKGDPDKQVSAIRKKIVREGEYYIVQTVIDGSVYFRITIMNPFTDMKILKGLIQKIRSFPGYL